MRTLLLSLLILFSPLSLATTVPDGLRERDRDLAPLVVDAHVEARVAYPDPDFHTVTRYTFQIERVLSNRTPIQFRAADTLPVWVGGGERENQGIFYNGFPRPYVGGSYRVYLRPNENSAQLGFQIAGLELGLISLSPERTASRNRTDGSNGQGNGAFLFWDRKFSPIPFFISSETFTGFPTYEKAIEDSFQSWHSIERSFIEFQAMGCSNSRKNDNDGVNNVILIRDRWNFDRSNVAITRNFYVASGSEREGQILDSDILLNAVDYSFTTTGETGKYDVQNTLTHEIGHLLGLGHDLDATSTMFASTIAGEVLKRTLTQNETDMIRVAYGSAESKTQFSSPGCAISSGNVGCLAVHGRGNPGSWFLPLFLMGLTVLLGRTIHFRGKSLF